MKLLKNHVTALCVAGCLGMVSPANAAITYLASGWGASDFLTLGTPTRSIEFDSSANLYIEDKSDDGSGTVRILKLEAATGYPSCVPVRLKPYLQ